jgi:hypothetical protein
MGVRWWNPVGTEHFRRTAHARNETLIWSAAKAWAEQVKNADKEGHCKSTYSPT